MDETDGVTKTRLTHDLEVVLARVRCQLIHDQTNGGRCANCISWAKHVGVPEHLPQFEHHVTADA